MGPNFGITPKWRNTGLVPKFFIIDYHAFAPLLLAMIKWNWTLLYFALTIVGFLTFIKIWSITPIGVYRSIRIKLSGRQRTTQISPMTIKRRVRW